MFDNELDDIIYSNALYAFVDTGNKIIIYD